MGTPILVTGATGTVGTHLVRELRRADRPVRIVTRHPEKISDRRDAAIAVVTGDLADPEVARRAVADCQRVFLLTGPDPGQHDLQAGVVAAAREVGVGHIVKLSALGARPDSPMVLAREHARTEGLIRESGMAWTFLHPHAFMQNLFAQIPAIKRESTLYAPTGEGRMAMIDARDVAAAAAAVLCGAGEGHAGRTYTLTGPEAVSMPEAAAILGEVLEREIRCRTVSPEAGREAMVSMGMPAWLADDLTVLNRFFREGGGAAVSGDGPALMGRAATPFARFADDHRAMFA